MQKLNFMIKCGLIYFCCLLSNYALGQQIVSNAPIVVKDGKVLSDRVIVRFHHQVINFRKNKTIVTGSDLKYNYPDVINCFRQFSQTEGLKLNDILFGRGVRGAQVGGRWVSHRTTILCPEVFIFAV